MASIARPQWPAEPGSFASGWEWLAAADPVLEFLARPGGAGPDDLESAIQSVVRAMREAIDAPAIALLARDDKGKVFTFRVVAWSDSDNALPDPVTFGSPLKVVADAAAALTEWMSGGSQGGNYALGAPLGRDDEDPAVCGWVVVLGESEIAWAFQLLEQVTWSLAIALREGWGVVPRLDPDEQILCRAAHLSAARPTPDLLAQQRVEEPLPPITPASIVTSRRSALHRERRPSVRLPDGTQPIDENVQFTVYRPRQIPPEQWCPILAFAHLAERRPDAPKDARDPIEEVKHQAGQVLGDLAPAYTDTTQDSRSAIPREGEITFLLNLPELRINPPQRSFRWLEDVHREEFRVMADARLDGRIVRGAVQAYLGAILIAEVSLAFRINAHAPRPDAATAQMTHAQPYFRIFPSYSRRDHSIVQQVETYARTLGHDYLRDVTTLRAGEVWTERLAELIRGADVFQLFWSRNSMRSSHVRREWEYALSLGRPHFVRPTYWETPLPEAPERGLPSEALKQLHFQLLPLPPTESLSRFSLRGMFPQLLNAGRLLAYAVAALALAALLWLLFGR